MQVFMKLHKFGFTINKIKHFLRDGRIEIVEKDNKFLSCQTCSKPIHSGWYCEDCLRQLKADSKSGLSVSPGNTCSNSGNDQSKFSKAEKK